MTEEEFKTAIADREYKRHRQRENFAIAWFLLGLPLVCSISWPIAVLCILGTVLYYVVTHFLEIQSKRQEVRENMKFKEMMKKELMDNGAQVQNSKKPSHECAEYETTNKIITIVDAPFPFPQQFKFEIGGFHGSAHQLRMVGVGKIEYKFAAKTYEWETPIILNPDQAHWLAFWREMNSVGFWNWQSEYRRRCCDGTHWSFCAQFSNICKQTKGSNGYPESDNSSYPKGGQFDLFLKAVRNLTGIDKIR